MCEWVSEKGRSGTRNTGGPEIGRRHLPVVIALGEAQTGKGTERATEGKGRTPAKIWSRKRIRNKAETNTAYTEGSEPGRKKSGEGSLWCDDSKGRKIRVKRDMQGMRRPSHPESTLVWEWGTSTGAGRKTQLEGVKWKKGRDSAAVL